MEWFMNTGRRLRNLNTLWSGIISVFLLFYGVPVAWFDTDSYKHSSSAEGMDFCYKIFHSTINYD